MNATVHALPDCVRLSDEQFARLLEEQRAIGGGQLLTYGQVAERSGLSQRTIKEMTAAGILVPAIRSGNAVRFRWPDVIEQLKTPEWKRPKP